LAGVFKRMSAILQAKTNKVLDKAEDPRETLDLSYEKQLESLQKVRRSVADVATARKRIELQAGQLQKQADKLQDQAKAALTQGNEDLAREALSRRAALGEQLSDLQTQHLQVADQEDKLVATSQRLQTQIEQFRTKKETLKASYTAAEAQTKVGEAVSGISTSMGDAGLAMQRAQDKIAGMQARAGAMDELLASGALTDLTTPVDDIQAQLDKVATGSQVDSELAALKAQLGAGAPAAALAASPDGDEAAADAEILGAPGTAAAAPAEPAAAPAEPAAGTGPATPGPAPGSPAPAQGPAPQEPAAAGREVTGSEA
jgi:phage shock protein A